MGVDVADRRRDPASRPRGRASCSAPPPRPPEPERSCGRRRSWCRSRPARRRCSRPRRLACSSSSITRTPAPSPCTKPSRSLSKGREACSGASLRVDIARMALKPPMPSGVIAASAPPQIITSASPRWTQRSASPMAWAPVAQAETGDQDGPPGAEADGDLPGDQVDDHHRDEEGREPLRALLQQSLVLELEGAQPADAGAEDGAHPLRLLALEGLVEAGLLHGLDGRRHPAAGRSGPSAGLPSSRRSSRGRSPSPRRRSASRTRRDRRG